MYDMDYLNKYIDLDVQGLSQPLNEWRYNFLKRAIKDPERVYDIIDVGCSTGSFLSAVRRFNNLWCVAGIDVNPMAVAYTVNRGIRAFTPDTFDVVYRYMAEDTYMTFFDTLEHMQDPRKFLQKYKPKGIVVSLPSLDGFLKYCPDKNIQLWKHYRPEEHLWNFTADDFVEFMLQCGYYCTNGPDWSESNFRRDSILKDRNLMAFSFLRVGS
jgi:SAM-dependent methyltransferase